MKREYLLLLLIPLALTLTGCFGKSDWRDTKTAGLMLTITPTVIYVDHKTNLTITLRELNGVGVHLNYMESVIYNELGQLTWHDVKTGTEAEQAFDKRYGTHYLISWGSLSQTGSVLFGPGFVGKYVQTMGGKDSNGNSVRASAEYRVRR